MHFLVKDSSVDVANMMYDVTENLVDTYHKDGDFEGFDFDLDTLIFNGFTCS